ncbi:family 43 glycosylhydrolase [Paenibacillus sp. sgz302251]|uniref:family 43 glycosylhydrolase n=1 Tax=Paenibacillus sp. sgz302251 TaxID=3414493 RepID=UPI003C7A4C8E
MNAARKRLAWIAALAVAIIIMTMGVWLFMNKSIGQSLQSQPYNGHGGNFKNSLASMDTPDPSVVYKDGFYYMTFTHNGTDIMIMKSRTIDFSQAERKVVWYPPVDTMYSANLWAPEIQYLQGKWYIYFAADNGLNENHRMYALEALSDDPLGEYSFKGQITDDTNKWAIDGLVLEHEEKLYFIWSGWEGDINIQQNTYIAPMSNPYTISGPRVMLSEPDQEWERAGGPPYINEGQAILKKDGRVFIAYSGAGSWTPFYAIGLLALEAGADPLDASKWTKLEKPLMEMNAEAGVFGPGHNSFVTSPDGTESWIVYHATSGEMDGWNNRKARAQRVAWGEEGLPIFGAPLSLNTAIEVPSGTGVYRAVHANRQTGDEVSFTGISSSFDTTVPMLLHYRNDTEAAIKLQAVVNGGEASELELAPTIKEEMGYIYHQLPLQAGTNELILSGLNVKDHVIAIEMIRYEAEYAQIGEEGDLQENPFASNERSASIQQGLEEALRFTNIRVPYAGDYNVTLAIANASDQEQKLKLSVNDGRAQTIAIPVGERNQFIEIAVSVKLGDAPNTLTIGNATGQLEIDYLGLTAEAK